MKKRFGIVLLLFALVLTACAAPGTGNTGDQTLVPQTGQDTEVTPAPGDADVTAPPDVGEPQVGAPVVDEGTGARPATRFFGAPLVGQNQAEVGNVQGMVIDTTNGRIHSVVVGVEEGQRLVPWQAVGEGFPPTTTVTGEQVMGAPAFVEDEFDQYMANRQDFETSYTQYWSGNVDLQAGEGETNYLLLRPYVGIPVRSADENNALVGLLSDLIVEQDGRIAYGVMTTDPSQNLGQGQVPVPWQAFNYDPDARVMTLNVDTQMLQNAPRFEMLQAPNMSAQGWDQEWNTYWQDAVPAAPVAP
jgi:hypothetical protein